MNLNTQPLIVSADPGSRKDWAVCSYQRLSGSSNCDLKRYPIAGLSKLIDELFAHAEKGHVLLGLDAPIKAFGGVQRPAKFKPDGHQIAGLKKYWPFNVNPYSTRPCEKALSSKPENNGLDGSELVTAIAETFGWDDPLDDNKKYTSLTLRHKGISVLGYQGAPHGPVVGTFLAEVEKRASGSSLEVSYDPEACYFYADNKEWPARVITVVETHPAVSAGFYAHYGTGENDPFFSQPIPRYKGQSKKGGSKEVKDGFEEVKKATMGLLESKKIELSREPCDDDDVDALLGLANLVELSEGKADLFGTVEDGYFLIPSNESGPCFRQLWKDAREKIVSPVCCE